MPSAPTTRSSICVACGPTPVTLVTKKADVRIVRCESCGLIYVNGCQTYTDLGDFYGPEYFRASNDAVRGYRDYVVDRDLHLRNSDALLSVIESAIEGSGRRLLDVGCAHGFFMDAARTRGWIPIGVDISAAAVRYARQNLGLEVYEGQIEDCTFDADSFEVVFLIGTIEHLPDPMKALLAITRLLKKRGLLFITTIDIEGPLGYFRWKPPEHLFYFSFRTLSHLIQKAGLSVESKRIHWSYYQVSDVTAQLCAYWGLPWAHRCGKILNTLGCDRVALCIPTNEILVVARKG